MVVFEENQPRSLWRLGKIVTVIKGSDGNVRGVHVQVLSKKGRVNIIHRPIQHLYPLEVPTVENNVDNVESITNPTETPQEEPIAAARPSGTAAVEA